MIAEIVPPTVVVEEVRKALPGVVLHEAEEALVRNAVPRRREEFATARTCAHRALHRLGVRPVPIQSGRHGEPLWPTDIVGSITHCNGLRAAAVARRSDVAALGVDAEPHRPLPDGVAEQIASASESEMVRRLRAVVPGVCWDAVLFSAKEAVFKAWFPLTRQRRGFDGAEITIDMTGTFEANLRVPGPALDDGDLHAFRGRWTLAHDLVLTAVTRSAP